MRRSFFGFVDKLLGIARHKRRAPGEIALRRIHLLRVRDVVPAPLAGGGLLPCLTVDAERRRSGVAQGASPTVSVIVSPAFTRLSLKNHQQAQPRFSCIVGRRRINRAFALTPAPRPIRLENRSKSPVLRASQRPRRAPGASPLAKSIDARANPRCENAPHPRRIHFITFAPPDQPLSSSGRSALADALYLVVNALRRQPRHHGAGGENFFAGILPRHLAVDVLDGQRVDSATIYRWPSARRRAARSADCSDQTHIVSATRDTPASSLTSSSLTMRYPRAGRARACRAPGRPRSV